MAVPTATVVVITSTIMTTLVSIIFCCLFFFLGGKYACLQQSSANSFGFHGSRCMVPQARHGPDPCRVHL